MDGVQKDCRICRNTHARVGTTEGLYPERVDQARPEVGMEPFAVHVARHRPA